MSKILKESQKISPPRFKMGMGVSQTENISAAGIQDSVGVTLCDSETMAPLPAGDHSLTLFSSEITK